MFYSSQPYSGNQTYAQSHICFLCFTVPSRVKNIHLSRGEDSLRVTWTPGEGDVDEFWVSLYRGSRQLDIRQVPKDQNQVMFGSLQPGQMYQVTVTSVSGELMNNNTVSGRTGENSWVINLGLI